MKQEFLDEVKLRIHLNDNDIRAAYAELCHQMSGKKFHPDWIKIKQYFEYLLACEAMKEYNWVQIDEGGWRKLTDEEIYKPWFPREENKE